MKKNLRKYIFLPATGVPVASGTAPKEITNLALSDQLRNMAGNVFVGNIISALITLALIIGFFVALFMLILGGLQWLSSGGDKAGIESARGRILSAIIGLILLFFAWLIINIIERFLGINLLEGPIKVPSLVP